MAGPEKVALPLPSKVPLVTVIHWLSGRATLVVRRSVQGLLAGTSVLPRALLTLATTVPPHERVWPELRVSFWLARPVTSNTALQAMLIVVLASEPLLVSNRNPALTRVLPL